MNGYDDGKSFRPFLSFSPMFKNLSPQEVAEYKEWARDNYEPLTDIKGIWHPVIQHECAKINNGE
jgi:hypothetical protein